MADPRHTVSALLASLISGTFGCYDAAAETINARWGRGASKGTISKKAAGLLDWTVSDVIALEDSAGRYPVTRMLAKRLDDPSAAALGSPLDHAANISREAGEAVCALLTATQEAGAGNIAQAIKELHDVENAASAARERLEALGRQ